MPALPARPAGPPIVIRREWGDHGKAPLFRAGPAPAGSGPESGSTSEVPMPFDPNRLLEIISQNVARFRRARAWSQQELAKRSGVSLRMIGMIESGRSNVSLAKLGNLAGALGQTFSDLVRDPDQTEGPVRPGRGTQLWQGRRPDTKVDLLESFPASRTMELWRWTVAPGDRYQGEPDLSGFREVVYVIQGELTLKLGTGTQVLKAGDSLSFPSDHPYTFTNTGKGTLRFLVNVVA